MTTTYGQFCPVAKAMELLDERWTLLVVRELLAGSRTWGDLRRGVPRMSPALLSKRLRTLARAGVVVRTNADGRPEYALTAAGEELRPVVEALGGWGVRWVPELGDVDLDPHLLMWDVHRNLDLTALPAARTVVHVRFTDVAGRAGRWWIVATRDHVELCDADPGHDVTLEVVGDLRTLTLVWRGDLTWSRAIGDGALDVLGGRGDRTALPRLLAPTPFARVPRPTGQPARV